MRWGQAFRNAWQAGKPEGKADARLALSGVEEAAALLSEKVVHAAYLAHYAALDLARLRRSASVDASEETMLQTRLRQACRTLALQVAAQPIMHSTSMPAGTRSPWPAALARALMQIDEVFLENKAVENPVAPLHFIGSRSD